MVQYLQGLVDFIKIHSSRINQRERQPSCLQLWWNLSGTPRKQLQNLKFRDIMDYKMINKSNPEGPGILLHSGGALGAAHRVTGAGSHYHLAIQLIWVGQGGRLGCVVPNFPYFYFVLMRYKYGIGKPKAMGKT